ncbi:MAG: sugar-phosphate isomerase, RpiB/LacA/LacB family, ribose 5-phosphate isomerase B [Candidatus Gottesmanbacteria bacterium GW2011_GWA2_43_14]|uniref:Sugar-phosphate isomerase, RpiB/LacA/LacB family, ribose 5-phosphate isomerase B n=1 Tax=Candidatus Gottesmanbacteria bacterium GW2011_GWA2_43_14 TaxID=1618443 RepID=A0A0G1DCJ4_9BACT|nr:MAG: sugar-phosphate isomerase, RpiB/LacA/LacB family, ribose 5-phosphate isomerase B [Candidatus Gottesmanbacteria bacterium GW2011_GWA2_43_14]
MIYLGADHGGFQLKEKVKEWLSEWGLEFKDMGNRLYEEGDNYPDFAFAVASKVSEDEEKNRGILICRSAVGMVIAANKVKGVRAAAVYDGKMAEKSRQHNNSNVIGLSGDNLTETDAKKILKTWLDTPFSDEDRHRLRVGQIEEFEKQTTG